MDAFITELMEWRHDKRMLLMLVWAGINAYACGVIIGLVI
jgi:hypothetical protein